MDSMHKSTAPGWEYRVIRSRRTTLALQIAADGTLLVRCPAYLSMETIDRFVTERSGWIEKQLAKRAAEDRLPALTDAQLRELAQQARRVIPERVAFYAPLVGVSWGRITVRTQRTRWGSCSGKGNLNFNCLLMLMPPEVLDYVVVHELCHLIEMNHSSKFWAEVARVLPDYKERRKWLRENGAGVVSRLNT